MSITAEWDDTQGFWMIISAELLRLDELIELIEKTDWRHGSHVLWWSTPCSAISERRRPG